MVVVGVSCGIVCLFVPIGRHGGGDVAGITAAVAGFQLSPLLPPSGRPSHSPAHDGPESESPWGPEPSTAGGERRTKAAYGVWLGVVVVVMVVVCVFIVWCVVGCAVCACVPGVQPITRVKFCNTRDVLQCPTSWLVSRLCLCVLSMW